MRVLVLATDAFGGYGGIAKYNRDLIKAICTHPDCVEVVALPRLAPGEWGDLPEGVTYITDGVGGKTKYIFSVLSTVLKDSNFDLVVCGHINLLPVAYLAKKMTNARLMMMMHGIDVWETVGGSLYSYLLRYIDMAVSVSELTKRRFLDWAPLSAQKVEILPNAIDIDSYRPGEKPESLIERYGLQNKIVIMTLGRISANEQYKGFDEVIDVIPLLLQEIPNVIYLLCGDGDDRKRLEEKVEKLGLQQHVIFTGYVSEEEKVEHYRLADVYVMPSHGEGFGIVLLEAMACGIPVVASKVDGGREALRDGILGIIVDPGDLDDIRSAINRSLHMQKGVIPEGIDYFSYDNFKQRCYRILNRVVHDEGL